MGTAAQRTPPPLDLTSHLAAIVESSDDAILSGTLDGAILSWNAAAEKLYGYPSEEIMGKPVLLLVPTDRAHEIKDALVRIRRGERVGHFESIGVHKDGSLVPVSVTISPVRDTSGDVAAAAAIVRDITERKRAEEVRSRLAAIVESSDDAIMSQTLDGVIVTWNAAAEKLYGYTAEEMVGKSVSKLIPADRPMEVEDILAKVRRGEGVDRHESIRLRKDGTPVPVWMTISPVRDSFGNVAAASSIARDITERKQSEVALAAADDQALVASRAKSDFLATVSHEIRTPMNGVVGLTGLLLDTELTETQRHHAEGVRASGEDLLGLINDILDFATIAAGKLDLEVVDFSPCHILEEVADLVAQSSRAKGVELVTHCSPDVPRTMRGDVGRVRQVLHNFATNAIKFTKAGEVALRAGLAEEATSEGAVVCFEVVDTGIGVDPATAEGLFEPFSQADGSSTRTHGGAGLGLAVCRRLAEGMGGTIGFDSRPGEGSTFWLRLPLRYAASAPTTSPGPNAGSSRTVAAGSAGTLLIVEDHAINREVARAIVAKLGYGSDLVANGIEALEALDRRAYDAVLMDCHMPEMDGFQATAEIRRREAGNHHVPIIAMTAGAPSEGRENCIAAGMDDYLSKPVKADQLAATLSQWLGAPPDAARNEVDGRPGRVGSEGVLDAAQLKLLRELAADTGDPHFLRGLVDHYLDQAVAQLAELREAAAHGDATALKGVAHSLKGASATIGATEVASACAALEQAAARDDLAGADGLASIDLAVRRATAALRALVLSTV